MTKNKKRGNAIIGALTLVPMLGFASLSVDIGMQRITNTQMQAAMDAAALSGVGYLDGSVDGVYNAIHESLTVVKQNTVYGNYEPTMADIKVGRYENGSFTELVPEIDFEEINAIRIIDNHTYDSYLSRYAFNTPDLTSDGSATAIRKSGGGAKYVDCYLPFAIPVCHFLNLQDGSNPMPMMLNLQNINTLGWGLPNNNPNTQDINDQLVDTCNNGTAEIGDDVYIGNGQNQAAVHAIRNLINAEDPNSTDPWPSDYFGSPYLRGDADGDGVVSSIIQEPPGGDYALSVSDSSVEQAHWGFNINGVVPIIDHPCGAGFTGTSQIVGWTYAYVYDVADNGNDKYLWMQFDFVNDYDIGYGYDPDALGNILGTLPAQLVD